MSHTTSRTRIHVILWHREPAWHGYKSQRTREALASNPYPTVLMSYDIAFSQLPYWLLFTKKKHNGMSYGEIWQSYEPAGMAPMWHPIYNTGSQFSVHMVQFRTLPALYGMEHWTSSLHPIPLLQNRTNGNLHHRKAKKFTPLHPDLQFAHGWKLRNEFYYLLNTIF
jgi:hypothetical protein